MKKIIIIPNSFKGTISSPEACEIIERAIHKVDSRIETVKIPISDGGDGFLDCFNSIRDTVTISVQSRNSMFEEIDSNYLIINQKTAVIELANTVGLVKVEKNNPLLSSTYGVGIQIKDALKKGIRDFIIGIGGSATNDGGTGILSALGARFYQNKNVEFTPNGGNLEKIKMIDISNLHLGLEDATFTIFSDVRNPLTGPLGAANVYARQKGADDQMIANLEKNMVNFSSFLMKQYRFSCDYEGAGAAGGVSVLMKCFLHAKMVRGIEGLLELVSFKERIKDADLIITGEGKLDQQSFYGKVLDGILSISKSTNTPVISFSGQIEGIDLDQLPHGLTSAVSLHDTSHSIEYTIAHSKEILEEKVIHLIQSYNL